MNEFEQRFQGLQPRWVGRGLLHPVGQHGHAFEEDKVLFENEAQAHDFARQFVRGVVTWEVTLHGMCAGSGSGRPKGNEGERALNRGDGPASYRILLRNDRTARPRSQ